MPVPRRPDAVTGDIVITITPADQVGSFLNSHVVERQLITFDNAPTGGSLILTLDGVSFTGLLFSSINAANLQAKLRTIAGLEAVTVTGSVGAGFSVLFEGVVGNVSALEDTSNDLIYNLDAEAYEITSVESGDYYDVDHESPYFFTIYNGLNEQLNIIPFPTDAADPGPPISGEAGTDVALDILVADTAEEIAVKLHALMNALTVGGKEGFVGTIVDEVVIVTNRTAGEVTDIDDSAIGDGMTMQQNVDGSNDNVEVVNIEVHKGRG